MSTLTDYLGNIADAIRNKKGTTGLINAQNFANEINNLQSVTIFDMYPNGSGARVTFDIASNYSDYSNITLDNIIAMPQEGLIFSSSAVTVDFTWSYNASTGDLILESSVNFSANTRTKAWKIAIIK